MSSSPLIFPDFHLIDPSSFGLPPVSKPDSLSVPETRPIFLPSSTKHRIFSSEKPSATIPTKKTFAFSEIVDQDVQEAYELYISDDLVGRLIQSAAFRGFILFIILVNSILVGAQTSSSVEERFASLLSTVDSVFLTIFVIELLLKFYNGFWVFWKTGWNNFDFAIVAVSLLGSGASYMASGRVLRILRVLRAFRTLRSISILQGLQVIVQTILRSLPDMANIAGLLMIVLFIWAVLGVSLFGQEVPEHFGSVGEAMFTCFIMLTLDGWWDITKIHRERGLFGITAIYFVIFITIGAFVFVNLVVGVTINNLLSEYKKIYARHKAQNRFLIDEYNDESALRDVVDVTAIPATLWSSQEPSTLPSLETVTVDGLKRYLLTVSVLERSIAEFSESKKALTEIYDIVRSMDKNKVHSGDENNNHDDELDSETFSEEEEEVGGDFLSLAIKKQSQSAEQQRQKVIDLQRKVLNQRRAMMKNVAEEQTRVERARQWMDGYKSAQRRN
ncbi:hypothetical protein GEMRC1_011782 [Eukaryota sp. GEM-RC1]